MKSINLWAIIALLFTATGFSSQAQSAVVQLDGSIATEVLGLEIGGTLYDVSFVFDTYNNLNTGDNFPFFGDAQGSDNAQNAINAALSSAGATGVVSASQPSSFYMMPIITSVYQAKIEIIDGQQGEQL